MELSRGPGGAQEGESIRNLIVEKMETEAAVSHSTLGRLVFLQGGVA